IAPASESTPPTIQARYTSHAEPTACIISAGTRKMPLPMMVPTTIALAWLTPSSRSREGVFEGACVSWAMVKSATGCCIGNINDAAYGTVRPLRELRVATFVPEKDEFTPPACKPFQLSRQP